MLKHLQKVVEEFVRRVCKQKGLPQATIDAAGGKVFTFGSYALGVHGPSSDIDTLVVAPKYVSIDDFFLTFPPTFKEMSRPEDIEEFVPVEEAHVPIIKMEYSGVSIDLIFASLPKMAQIPRDMATIEKKNLEGLGEAATRSVNGTRVTKELLAAVPPGTAFRHALRAIKLWSNRRFISSRPFSATDFDTQAAVYTEQSSDILVELRGPSWSRVYASFTPTQTALPSSPNFSA